MLEFAEELGVHGARAIREEASRVFAEFAVRAIAVIVDCVIVIVLTNLIKNELLAPLGILALQHWVWFAVIAIPYCTGLWLSPLNATLGQLFFGIRVFDEKGGPLSVRSASLRSVTLLTTIVFFVSILTYGIESKIAYLSLAPLSLVLLALITPHRQAAHDLVAKSVALNRRALKTAAQRDQISAYLLEENALVRKLRRPSMYRMMADIIVVVIPVFALTIGIQTSKDRNLKGRVSYAYFQSGLLQQTVKAFYDDYGRLPVSADELTGSGRIDYPAGGFAQLEENGVIRIQFSVIPQLKNGGLLLAPMQKDGVIEWKCRRHGDIEIRLLPANCRQLPPG